jgi:hypothetical protein
LILRLGLERKLSFLPAAKVLVASEQKEQIEALLAQYLTEWPVRTEVR